MKKFLFPFIICLLFALMLFYSGYTFQGALNGLNLWLFTVLPSLLPYMMISTYMTENGTFRCLAALFSPITTHIFHLSKNCGYVIVLGFLCGYPIGSKLCADLVRKGQISLLEGQILLSFCNNVSPAFLLTYLIHHIIDLPKYNHFILFIMIFIPLLFGILLSNILFFFSKQKNNFFAGKQQSKVYDQSHSYDHHSSGMDFCIINSFENCLKLGGYIILFSILNCFLSNMLAKQNVSPIFISRISTFFEITSGLHDYQTSNIPAIFRITECPALTVFGGLCCFAQTASMIKGSGLSLKLYLLAKIFLGILLYFLLSFLVPLWIT